MNLLILLHLYSRWGREGVKKYCKSSVGTLHLDLATGACSMNGEKIVERIVT